MDNDIKWQTCIDAKNMHSNPYADEMPSSTSENIWEKQIILAGKPNNAEHLLKSLKKIPNILFTKRGCPGDTGAPIRIVTRCHSVQLSSDTVLTWRLIHCNRLKLC